MGLPSVRLGMIGTVGAVSNKALQYHGQLCTVGYSAGQCVGSVREAFVQLDTLRHCISIQYINCLCTVGYNDYGVAFGQWHSILLNVGYEFSSVHPQ